MAGQERLVGVVDVTRQQGRAQRVRSRHQDSRDPRDVRSEPCGRECADEVTRRHENLAAEMAALLLRRELVLEMDAGRPGFDHRPHQLVRAERPAESGLGVGHDREQPVAVRASLRARDLIGAQERVVQALDQRGRAVGGIEALVRVRVAGEIRIRGDLPPREVDRLEAGPRHLHRLVSGDGPERGDVVARSQEAPQAVGAAARERVLHRHRAAEPVDVVGGIRPADPAPAWRSRPFVQQRIPAAVPAAVRIGGHRTSR